MTHQSTKLDQASVPDSRDCSGPHITAEMPPLSGGEGQESTAGGWPPVGSRMLPNRTQERVQEDNRPGPVQG